MNTVFTEILIFLIPVALASVAAGWFACSLRRGHQVDRVLDETDRALQRADRRVASAEGQTTANVARTAELESELDLLSRRSTEQAHELSNRDRELVTLRRSNSDLATRMAQQQKATSEWATLNKRVLEAEAAVAEALEDLNQIEFEAQERQAQLETSAPGVSLASAPTTTAKAISAAEDDDRAEPEWVSADAGSERLTALEQEKAKLLVLADANAATASSQLKTIAELRGELDRANLALAGNPTSDAESQLEKQIVDLRNELEGQRLGRVSDREQFERTHSEHRQQLGKAETDLEAERLASRRRVEAATVAIEADLAKARRELAEATAKFARDRGDLTEGAANAEALGAQLKLAQQSLEENKTKLVRSQAEAQRSAEATAKLATELSGLRKQLSATTAALDHQRNETAATLKSHGEMSDQLEQARRELTLSTSKYERELKETRGTPAEASVAERLSQAEKQLATAQARFDRELAATRRSSLEAATELRNELDTTRGERDEAADRLDSERTRNRSLHHTNTELAAELDSARKSLFDFKAELDEAAALAVDSSAAELTATAERAEKAEKRLAVAQAELDRATKELGQARKELTTELEEARSRLAELEATNTDLRRQLDDATETNKTLTAGNDAVPDSVIDLRKGANNDDGERDAEIETLQQRIAQLERLSVATERLTRPANRSESGALALAPTKPETADSSRRGREAAKRLAESVSTTTATPTSHRSTTTEAKSKSTEPKDAARDKLSATTRLSEIATRTAGDGPLLKDDLTEIYGVGPKYEGVLNGLGISSFAQLARCTEDDIEAISDALGNDPKRILRDDWIGKARQCHQDKYASDPLG